MVSRSCRSVIKIIGEQDKFVLWRSPEELDSKFVFWRSPELSSKFVFWRSPEELDSKFVFWRSPEELDIILLFYFMAKYSLTRLFSLRSIIHSEIGLKR
jgi:hypothetical protein